MKGWIESVERKTQVKAILICCTVFFSVAPSDAKPLTSVWKLESETLSGRQTVKFGEPFLEQRMVPARLVKTNTATTWAAEKLLPADTYLFKVFQADGKTAYCTFKDQSIGNVAKSFFIPALDRRPCFIDANYDGEFESVFTVFDKYGSAITPSGNISSAKPINTPIRYSNTDSSSLPNKYGLLFSLRGSRQPEKTDISVFLIRGAKSRQQLLVGINRQGSQIDLINLEVFINSIIGDEATLNIAIKPDLLLLGDSNGSFYGSKISVLPAGWEK